MRNRMRLNRGRIRLIGSAALLLTPGARAYSTVPQLVDSYTALLQTHPLETKLATAAVLAAAGDAIAQRREPGPYNSARAGSFVLFDMCYRGGFQHFAFPWIIQNFRGDMLQSLLPQLNVVADPQIFSAVECTMFNQLVVVPIVYYPLFFGTTGLVQGLTLDESLQRARERFVDLTLRNWKFWIPAQLLQFALLPEELQVPYTCVMGLVWNIILSASAGSAKPVEQLEESPIVGRVLSTRKVLSQARAKERAKSKTQ